MKKIILWIAVAGICCFAACSTEQKPVITDVTTLRLLPDENVVFGEDGGSRVVKVETNGESWDADATQQWVKIEPEEGSFRMTVAPNTSVEAMPDAVVTVTAIAGDMTDRVSFTVSQEGAAPAEMSLEPETETLRMLYGGSEMEFYVSSNKVWNAVSDQAWCTVTAKDEHTMVISAGENETFDPMPLAVVTVTAGVAPNAVVKTIAVSQEGRPEVVAADLSAAGSANCYVVSGAGTYMFNASVKGNNASTPGITPVTISPVSAELLWQDYYADGAGLIDDVKYERGYVYFSTGETFHAGNALIAAKDAAGEILWSWHIWCVAGLQAYAYNSYETGAEAFRVLDRNLGAVSNVPGNDYSLGLYYQWGRKDPFPAAAGHGDGTSRKDVDKAFCWSAPDDYTQPGYTARMYDAQGAVVNSEQNMKWIVEIGGKQVDDGVRNPMTFYYQVASSQADWLAMSDDNLWGNPYSGGKSYVFGKYKPAELSTGAGEKSIYDPCPVGYKVAPGNYWCETGMVYTTNYKSELMAYDAANFGYVYTRADGTKDWYPLAGRRQHSTAQAGKLYGISSSAFLWSSSPAADPSGEITDSQKQSAATVSVAKTAWTPVSSIRRASGMPVRCVKE